jgi:uncharacterized protein (TIGR02145 family)
MKYCTLIIFLFILNFLEPKLIAQVTDINGKIYKTVVIGSQTWMAENLNVDRFRNGDIIQEAKTDEDWKLAGEKKQPAWCYYDNNPANAEKYGKLYNWYAVTDARGLAPIGWRVPTNKDFETVIQLFGESTDVNLKSIDGWEINDELIATKPYNNNLSGFNGYPVGNRTYKFGFSSQGFGCDFWCFNEFSNPDAWVLSLSIDHMPSEYLLSNLHNKSNGYSIRCIKD